MHTQAKFRKYCMQQHVYRQLSELTGGTLPSFVIPTSGAQVLDIGWEMGESVYELVLKYPALHFTGIAKDESAVIDARSLVSGISNVFVHMQNITQINGSVIASASYELIHLHFLAAEITFQEIPQLLLSLARLSRPGGYIVWAEAELPITTSMAFQRLCSLLLQALQARGDAYTQGNSLGLTARMGSMLTDAGYKFIHSKAFAIDISARSKGNDACITQLSISRQQIYTFLLETGCTTGSEFEDLYREIQQEIREELFCGLLYVRTVVAKRS
jgi:Methyltransferase domain